MTRIDRRALFTSGAAAALLAATGLTPDAKPREGGRLRLAVPREDGSLEIAARGAVYDSLTEIGPDGVLRPELATAWFGSSDARDWQFDLRKDVTFHDGTALTADDAAMSLAQQDIPGLVSVEATGELTLRIALDIGNPDLPFLLADSGLIIAPGGSVDGPLSKAVGTGVYHVTRAQEGRNFLAQKISDHYKAGHAGWVDTFEIVVIPDAKVRAEALRDGFVDVAELPHSKGLLGRGEFLFHPSAQDMALAARSGIGMPRLVSARGALDDGRIAERWWIA